MTKSLSIMLLLLPAALAQNVDIGRQGKNFDFTNASFTRVVKVGAALPSTCQTGELFFLSTAAAGANFKGCVAQNTWSTLSGAASNGNLRATWIEDMAVDLQSPTVLRVGASCSAGTPCNVSIGNRSVIFSSPATATITGGAVSGSAFVFVDAAGQINVQYPSGGNLAISCSGCTATGVVLPGVPTGAVPIASITLSAGQWQSISDRRSTMYSQPLVAGNGISLDQTQGIASFSINGAIVPQLNALNQWTGNNDFSAASQFRVKAGAGVPAAASCDTAGKVGSLYARTDAAGTNLTLYLCANTAAATYAWELTQMAGGGSGTVEVQADGVVSGSRAKLNFVPGLGANLACADDAGNARVNCTINIDSSTLNTTYARLGAANVYTTGFLHDFSAAELRIPTSAAYAPTASGRLGFDTNSLELRIGRNNVTQTVALRDTSVQPLTIKAANEGSTGTGLNRLAKLNGSGQALLTAVNETNGAYGIVSGGAGNSGTAEIAVVGQVLCVADNTANVGDYVILGTATAGRCRSAGSTYPTAGQVIGRWLGSTSAGSSAIVMLFGLGAQAPRTYLTIGLNGSRVAASSTQYAGVAALSFDSAESNRRFGMPTAGTVAKIAVTTIGSQPSSGACTCTVRAGGADTGVAVTIAANAAGGVYTGSGSSAFAANAALSVRCVNSATAVSADFAAIVLEVQ